MHDCLRFEKYSTLGNTFIVVDETRTPLADDGDRSAFARWALDANFGIGGADNVLCLRRQGSDVVFRIFEHDGSETLSCGNGLLSAAAALHRASPGTCWRVLTEVPTGRPRPVLVGLDAAAGHTWVDMGRPRPVPDQLFERGGRRGPAATGIDVVDGLQVPLPGGAGWTRGLPPVLRLGGRLVFTGEPHLVLLSGHGLPSLLESWLFPSDSPEAGDHLVEHLGASVNSAYRHLFPHGVHLDLARVLDSAGTIEYRTYERAIYRETLACGSGAVATAHIARQLGLTSGSATSLWPHRCRRYRPDACLRVVETASGCVLSGRPQLVCAGTVCWPPAGGDQGGSAR